MLRGMLWTCKKTSKEGKECDKFMILRYGLNKKSVNDETNVNCRVKVLVKLPCTCCTCMHQKRPFYCYSLLVYKLVLCGRVCNEQREVNKLGQFSGMANKLREVRRLFANIFFSRPNFAKKIIQML